MVLVKGLEIVRLTTGLGDFMSAQVLVPVRHVKLGRDIGANYSMDKLGQVYMAEIIKLHGAPMTIISDKGS